ncbi:MAG: feruloyl-CoA synthase [Panacagrimonas sp.]
MSTLFAAPRMQVLTQPDGSLLMQSADPLSETACALGVWLEQWAMTDSERTFLAQRDASGQWQNLSYGETRRLVYAVATWLLRNAESRPGPVAILSDNSLDHAVLMLAAMHVGIPVAAISTAYSLASKDHAKLKNLIRELEPGLIYVSDAKPFGPALQAIAPLHRASVVAGRNAFGAILPFETLLEGTQVEAVQRAFSKLTPDTVAKILYTSGSTGEPKGVLNTQRMLCSNQQARVQIWPFLDTQSGGAPPVLLDWLPWNHTFGANHNFNLVLRNGGTLYIDGGRPMPGLFDTTLANLREIAPTLYFNVPRGYDMLVAALRADAELRRLFFSRMKLLFYAAAALPQHLWDALLELSRDATGAEIPLVSAWGTTETAPLATDCHFQASRSGNIGVPIPGTELKLVPVSESAYEIRVRGPNITPGYFKRPEQTAKAFDEEDFYLTGDAVRFADPSKPEAGLVFGGRISEDFKLSTGTWVNVGSTRIRAVECLAPLAQDLVIAGHDRDFIAFLVFPNLVACRQFAGLPADAIAEHVLAHPAVREAAAAGLRKLKSLGGGSSMYAPRCLLLVEPPSIDGGEITDKGYINQRAVLLRRAESVEALFAAVPDRSIIHVWAGWPIKSPRTL